MPCSSVSLPSLAALQHDVSSTVAAMRAATPLVHNITNLVVMHTTANALLAVGGSPLMAHAEEELSEMLRLASALVLNIGTLDTRWIASMRRAGELARAYDLPTVLDPVGAGASALRTETARTLLEQARPVVLRGNASEIMALAGNQVTSRGVDSLCGSDAALEAARDLAVRYGCVVSVSGEQDLITDGAVLLRTAGGSPLMTRVTGMGCTSTAITAACLAGARKAQLPALIGAAAGMAIMAEAGDRAAALCAGPGSFLIHFLDSLAALTPDAAAAHLVAAERLH